MLLLVFGDPKAKEEQHLGSFECLILAKALPPRGTVPITEGWRLKPGEHSI